MNQSLAYFLKYYLFRQGRSRLAEMIAHRFRRAKSLLFAPEVSYDGDFSYSRLQNHQLKTNGDIHFINDVVITPDGYIWKDNYLVTGVVPYYHSKPCIKPIVVNKIPDALFTASPVNIHNYYHWLIDVMPIFLKGKEMKLNYPYLCTSSSMNFQKEMDLICDLNLQAISEVTYVEHLAFIPHWQASYPPMWVVEVLQKAFSHIGTAPRDPWRILLLDRRKTYRQILNQDQIFEALKPLGFELIDSSLLTVEEQISLFRESRIVVSCHGAGLTNLIFMQPGTFCIEIGYRHDRKYQLHYENIANLCKINHSWIDVPHAYLPGAHMVIEPQVLRDVLSKIM